MEKRYIHTLIIGSAVLGSLAVAGTAFAEEFRGREGGFPEDMRIGANVPRPMIVGNVTSVSGNTITISARQGGRGMRASTTAATSTYTVDATNAKVYKNGTVTTASAIAAGDIVAIEGTVNGSTITATAIRYGMMAREGIGGMMGRRPNNATSSEMMRGAALPAGNGQPIVGGKVTAINGNTVSVTNASNVVYTVDASSATIRHAGIENATVSSISVGDNVIVQGTINGTSITATTIIDPNNPNVDQTRGADQAEKKEPAPKRGFMSMMGGFFGHLFGF